MELMKLLFVVSVLVCKEKTHCQEFRCADSTRQSQGIRRKIAPQDFGSTRAMKLITFQSLFAWALILYLCLSIGSIIGTLCVLKPARWRPILALLLGLTGVWIGWEYFRQVRAGARNPNQTPSARAAAWIQWSSAAGGNNHWYALTPSAANWLAAQKLYIRA
jgi:hypothetical protein